MNSQIFKNIVPKEILYDLLNKVCVNNNDHFLFDKISYKKGEFQQLLVPFCASMLDYYHTSKHFYLTRKLTYSSFVTILRQLCKATNIKYTLKVVYIRSEYSVIYYIYKD